MKKITSLFFAAMISVMAFSQNADIKRNKQPIKDAKDKRIFHVTKNLSYQTNPLIVFTRLSYTPASEFTKDLDKKKKLGVISEAEYQKQRAELPQGGSLSIETRRKTPEQSNASNLTVVIQDMNGNELQRTQCPATRGEYMKETLDVPMHYSSTVDIKINVPLTEKEYNIYILDEGIVGKFEYILKVN